MTIATRLSVHDPSSAEARERTGTCFPRSILLATDGEPAAVAATRVTAALARQRRSRIDVLSVMHPVALPFPAVEAGVIPFADDVDWTHRQSDRALEIRQQLDAIDADLEWPVEIRAGVPAIVIGREAERRHVDLIAMGLRRHGKVGRLLGDQTTLRVVRSCQARVLAVIPTLTALPRRIIVAVDFSRASLRAARAVMGIAAPDATLILTHVRPNFDYSSERSEGTRTLYSQGVVGSFARLRDEIGAPEGVKVDAALLDGVPANELLALADRADADLIAVGSHYHSFIDRIMLGSVTTDLLRAARRSLLIMPPTPAALR